MVESDVQRSTAPAGFFRVPGLFVRLSSKGTKNNGVDPDSVWSPTSPLDFKSLRSSPPRVGLGLVDALTADDESSLRFGGKISFLDSIRPFLELALPKPAAACGKDGSAAGVTALGEAADSEYTCVIARGANPRTTHILGGETLEVRNGVPAGPRKVVFTVEPFGHHPSPSPSSPSSAASGRCRCCMKRLQEGKGCLHVSGREGVLQRRVQNGIHRGGRGAHDAGSCSPSLTKIARLL